MSRDQQLLQDMFVRNPFGPRNGFAPREWQDDFAATYGEDASRFADAFPGVQHSFCLYAGTGGGKTKAAAQVAARQLNLKVVDQVVFICPNKSICRKTRKDFLHYLDIDLVSFNAKSHRDGVPRTKQGYVMTYQHLMKNPELHGRLSSHTPTLVIFDEIHHLGDRNGWGDAARTAFDGAKHILALTGTPYRSDNTKIPFVTYEPADGSDLLRFRPDFSYNLGRAVADGVCRKPVFAFHDGVVRFRIGPDADERTVSFDDADVSDEVSSIRLRGAVKYGTETRRNLLAKALDECKQENRKAIIFLGGDTEGDQTPTEDATTLLPTELETLGLTSDDYEVVVGDDPNSQKKIEQFGQSGKRVLISINMVSEGTDIPQISAAIFLTTITAKQTTVQRIGRVLRLMGPDDPHKAARIYMFGDPDLIALTREIEDEIQQEVKIREAKQREPGTGPAGEDGERFHRVEAFGVSGGDIKTVVMNGREFEFEAVKRARDWCIANGLPRTEATYYAVLRLMEAKNGDGNAA